jgi:SAM-dependent methyltransferase
VRLDLGCGPSPADGYEGVDLFPGPGVVHVVDLEQPWPWDPNSVEGVNCSHLVEHVRDLPRFMAELWRVCKDGAEVLISHPYQFNVRAWQDPTHVRALNEVSWFYFDAQWRGNRPEFGETDFVLVDLIAVPEENWKETAALHPEEFERAARNQINVISDLRVTLRARK